MLKVTLRNDKEIVCYNLLFINAYRSGYKGFYPFAELHIHKNQQPIEIAIQDIAKIEYLNYKQP